MDKHNISRQIFFLLEGMETISFSTTSLHPSVLPDESQLNMKVTGIQLSYAYCGEQQFGIVPMARAFGAEPKGFITKVPKELTLTEQSDVTIMKFGPAFIAPEMIEITRNVGMTGYWDSSNLIICSSEKYKSIIKNAFDFIKPNKAKFAFKTIFGGPNLMILKV